MNENGTAAITGRIAQPPDEMWREHVLEPQFRYEAEHLLPHYLLVEKVLLAEYERLGLMATDEVRKVADVLGEIAAEGLCADPGANLSDMALAVERRVTERFTVPVWHVDRSRNDLQA